MKIDKIKMKKICLISLIVILTFIIIMLLCTLIHSAKNGFDLEEIEKIPENIRKEEKILIDKTNTIKISLKEANVTIMFTDDEEVRVVQYSNKELKQNEMFLIDKETKHLTITESKQKLLNNIFKKQITDYDIYIPKSYSRSLIIETISGDINITEEMNFNNIKVQTTNGDITFSKPVVADKLVIKTTSGNIQLNDINANELTIETSTGDVQAQKITGGAKEQILAEAILKPILGNIKLPKLENLVDIETVSGNINVEDIGGEMILQTSSGNICLNNCKIKEISKITTVSGNLKIKIDTNNINCKISTTTVSGTINLSDELKKTLEKPYVKLLLQTASGNIEID